MEGEMEIRKEATGSRRLDIVATIAAIELRYAVVTGELRVIEIAENGQGIRHAHCEVVMGTKPLPGLLCVAFGTHGSRYKFRKGARL